MNADFPPPFGDTDFLLAGRALEIFVVLPVLYFFAAGVDGRRISIRAIPVRAAAFTPAEQPFHPLFKPLVTVQLFLAGVDVPGQRPVEGKNQGQDPNQPDNGIHPAVHNPDKKAADQRSQQIDGHAGD